jgi:hypothetical protein
VLTKVLYVVIPKFSTYVHTAKKIRFMYSKNETAQPRSRFLHSCICEQKRWTNRRNMYVNRSLCLCRAEKKFGDYGTYLQIFNLQKWLGPTYTRMCTVCSLVSYFSVVCQCNGDIVLSKLTFGLLLVCRIQGLSIKNIKQH